jgi:hypothetical protein
MWAFVRNMVGNGSHGSATGQALSADNRHFEVAIRNKIRSRTTDPLNDAFTPEELDKVMPKSKSNATGPDLIQNKMTRNLSKPNKTSLLHLFNTLLTNTYVPAQ